ncbi:YdcF family protein [Paenibacillus thalictri]|nr:YdcF family protein [Paenibacillus thalictri]
MLYILKFIFSLISPPGLFILLALLLALYLYRSHKRAALLSALLAGFMYLCCMPLLSDSLLRAWEYRYTPPADISADAIVVLTGGAVGGAPGTGGIGGLTGDTLSRAVTAVELYRKSRLPIIVSGGQVFADTGNEGRIAKQTMISLGVPESAILLDDTSRNTAENAEHTRGILTEHGFKQPLLITSAYHMERAVHHFKNQGVYVIPYPTDYRTSPQFAWDMNKLAPSASALAKLTMLVKEVLGLLQR